MDKPRYKNTNSIIIWPSSFAPVSGGMQTAAREVGQFLKKNNWNVRYITNRYPKTLDKKDVLNGIEIHRLIFLHSPINYLKSLRFDLLLGWLVFKPITLIKLFLIFLKARPSIVHIHFPDNQIFESLVLKKIFNFKLVASFHGNDIEKLHSGKTFNYKFFLMMYLLKKAELITGCSNYIIRKIKLTFPKINHQKLLVLHNGVAEDFQNTLLKKKKDKYFFSAARNAPVKGIDSLFSLSPSFNQFLFKVAGDNYKRTDDQSNVRFLGLLDSSKIIENMSKCSVTIIPSRNEAFGIVIAEALCCGSPIVATNVGGIPEVLDLAKKNLTPNEISIFHYWVKLVDPDIQSLILGINEILKNSHSIEHYLKIVPKIQKVFQWNNLLKNYHKSLTGLLLL